MAAEAIVHIYFLLQCLLLILFILTEEDAQKPVFKTQHLPDSVLNGTTSHSNSQSQLSGVLTGNYELIHQVKLQVCAEEFLPFLTSPHPTLPSG